MQTACSRGEAAAAALLAPSFIPISPAGAAPNTVTVTPAAGETTVGEQTRVTASATDDAGDPVPGGTILRFSVLKPGGSPLPGVSAGPPIVARDWRSSCDTSAVTPAAGLFRSLSRCLTRAGRRGRSGGGY
jgi:hypothetical protein